MRFEKENNPYTLQFSFIPPQIISRKSLTEEIINDYTRKVPTFRGHFITGVRGSGKSVMMAEIANIIQSKPDWIAVDIESPESDIIDSLARGLYRIPSMKALFLDARIDISVMGLGVSVEKSSAIASNQSDALRLMLGVLKKAGKKILVTIDEVTYCKEIATFSHTLSSYARSDFEIYVLMTGLKENIKAIKNDKSLTFLYRAKEHVLEPLNITAITSDYEKVFHIEREFAERMAFLTRGYSFAFQVLGYLYWEELSKNGSNANNPISLETLYSAYDQFLAEFVYDKIWSELSPSEKKVAKAIAHVTDGEVKKIRDIVDMNSSKFSVYRERLIDKGLINGSDYGRVRFTLPRFEEYVLLQERGEMY